MGSNNNVGVSPGQNPRGLHDRSASPNMHIDNLSGRSISPGGDPNKAGFATY